LWNVVIFIDYIAAQTGFRKTPFLKSPTRQLLGIYFWVYCGFFGQVLPDIVR